MGFGPSLSQLPIGIKAVPQGRCSQGCRRKCRQWRSQTRSPCTCQSQPVCSGPQSPGEHCPASGHYQPREDKREDRREGRKEGERDRRRREGKGRKEGGREGLEEG